jgi:hypothetical protein
MCMYVCAHAYAQRDADNDDISWHPDACTHMYILIYIHMLFMHTCIHTWYEDSMQYAE